MPESVPALTLTGRTIQACDRCRFKKVRCDGAVPTCGRCQRAGLKCLTTVKLNRKSYPRSYTESIEQRLRELEAEVQQLQIRNNDKDRRIKELESTQSVTTVHRRSLTQPGNTVVTITHPDAGLSAKTSTDEPLSREVGRMNIDGRGVGRFMGSSSGIFFVGTAEQKLASLHQTETGKVDEALLRVDVDDPIIQYPLQPVAEDAWISVRLPAKETAERYIDAWFDSWKCIFPILHRPSFMEAVDRLYSAPTERRDPGFAAIFFLVLAIGCRHTVLTGVANDGIPTVHSSGEDLDLFGQSTRFRNDILAQNDIMTLQYQELITLWYLYTGKRSLAFQMTGGVTRLALELGLHRHTRRFHFNPLVTELRKRVFWVGYLLDSFVSAVEGLPKSFRDQDIDVELPSDVDDDYINADEYLLSLPGEPTGMILFVSLIKLVRILSNTLEVLYTTTDRRQTVTKIRSVDRHLDQWLQTLPDHLQVASPPAVAADSGPGPAASFVHLTYLYTRFTAHRVAISFHPKTGSYWTSLQGCMDLAQEIIHLNQSCQRHLLVFDAVNPGSHVYTLWSCGLMILYGLCESKTVGDHTVILADTEDLKSASEICVELLRSLVASGRSGEQVRVDHLTDIITTIFDYSRPFVYFSTSTSTHSSGVHSNPMAEDHQLGSNESTPKPPPLPHEGLTSTTTLSLDPLKPEVAVTSPSLPPQDYDVDFSNSSPNPYEQFQLMSSTSHAYDDEIASIDAAQSLETLDQIWDDPVFNVTPLMHPTLSGKDPSTIAEASSAVGDHSQSSRKRMRDNSF